MPAEPPTPAFAPPTPGLAPRTPARTDSRQARTPASRPPGRTRQLSANVPDMEMSGGVDAAAAWRNELSINKAVRGLTMAGVGDAQLKDIFALIDSHGAGSIALDGVKHYCSCLDRMPPEPKLKQLVATVSSGTGAISADEFIGVIAGLVKVTGVSAQEQVVKFNESCYRELFLQTAALDGQDGVSDISKSDLVRLFDNMQIGMTDEDVRKVFLKFDEDGSGRIEEDEFLGILQYIEKDKGLSLSQCVLKFKAAREASQQRVKAFAANQFGGTVKKWKHHAAVSPEATLRTFSVHKQAAHDAPCPTCPLREDEIAQLRDMNNRLEDELRECKKKLSEAELASRLEEARSPLGLPRSPTTARRSAKGTYNQDYFDGSAFDGVDPDSCMTCDVLKAEIEKKDGVIAGLEVTVHKLQSQLKSGSSGAPNVKQLHADLEGSNRKRKVLEGKLTELMHMLRLRERRIHELEAENAAGMPRQESAKAPGAEAAAELQEWQLAVQELQCHLADRDHTIAQLEQQLQDEQGAQCSKTHVWALERALEIRANEIERLHTSMKQFAARIETLDRRLAEAILGVLAESQDVMEESGAPPPPMDAAGYGGGAAAAAIAAAPDDDTLLLQQQVWTLQAALEIRTRENERLEQTMKGFISQVSQLDGRLAESMVDALKESAAQREEDEHAALDGRTAAEVLTDVVEQQATKKKRRKAGRKGGAGDAGAGDDELAQREIGRLRRLLEKKEGQLQQYRQTALQARLDFGGAWRGPRGHMQGMPGRDADDPTYAAYYYKEQAQRLEQQLEATSHSLIAGARDGWKRAETMEGARRLLSNIRHTSPHLFARRPDSSAARPASQQLPAARRRSPRQTPPRRSIRDPRADQLTVSPLRQLADQAPVPTSCAAGAPGAPLVSVVTELEAELASASHAMRCIAHSIHAPGGGELAIPSTARPQTPRSTHGGAAPQAARRRSLEKSTSSADRPVPPTPNATMRTVPVLTPGTTWGGAPPLMPAPGQGGHVPGQKEWAEWAKTRTDGR